MSREQQVVVADIRIPFWSMVILLVKVAFAAIPAAFIMAIFWALLASVFGVVGLVAR
ncbi:MAG TPA: hypothetical protein VGC54_01520 [Planctomycetota bacterium]